MTKTDETFSSVWINRESTASFQKPGIGFYDGLLVLRCSFNIGGREMFLQAGARCSTGNEFWYLKTCSWEQNISLLIEYCHYAENGVMQLFVLISKLFQFLRTKGALNVSIWLGCWHQKNMELSNCTFYLRPNFITCSIISRHSLFFLAENWLGDAFSPVLQTELADRLKKVLLVKATRQAMNLLESKIDWT